MTKAQWAAVYTFCEDMGLTKWELLNALKNNGTVDRSCKLEELSDYVSGTTYDEMMKWLGDNV